MEYTGKKQFKVIHYWHDEIFTIVEIDFDFPDIMQSIKEMVEFWGGWEQRLRWNDGDYVKTFLKQIAGWCWTLRLEYNPHGIRNYFNGREGWNPLDGTEGINILQCETLQIDEDEFEIEETEGVEEFKPKLFF